MRNPDKPDNTSAPLSARPKKSRLGKLTLQKDIFDNALRDNLKSTVDIVALFAHFGVKLAQKGKSYIGTCPWHEDSTPSLSVDKAKGLYNCFGCGESGDIFTLVEKMKGCTFTEAMEFLQQQSGLSFSQEKRTADELVPSVVEGKAPTAKATQAETESPSQNETSETAEEKIPPSPKSAPEKSSVTLDDVQSYYAKKLIEHKDARSYLQKRGITNETISYFRIGFADGTLTNTIGESGFKALQEKGIFTDKKYELMKGCITVPLQDIDGRVLSFYGRRIDNTSKMPPHLYLSGDHTAVLHEKAYQVYDSIILTESVIDALSLFSVGIQNVSCIYGTNGLTPLHIAKLHEHAVREVILAFDNDEAGTKAVEKYTEVLVNEGFVVKTIVPEGRTPSGAEVKDWNELLVNGSLAKEDVLSSIDSAEVVQPESSGRKFTASDNGIVLERDEVRYEVRHESTRQRIDCWYGENVFIDTVNLYASRSRKNLVRDLAEELGLERDVVEADIKELVVYLVRGKDTADTEETPGTVELTEQERAAGMEFLTRPDLFDCLVRDMDTLGYIGEELNKILVYIVAHSYQLASPFSVIVTSQSASGKSALVETVEDLMPKEHLISVSSFSDKVLNYSKNINRKFLTISEMMHNDEIEYQLRDIQSKHKLSRMMTMKDAKTGLMEGKQIETEAYTAIAMTTTASQINQENASRCFIIQVDESAEQTARIMREQKKKFKVEGMDTSDHEVPQIIARHHAAGRLLKVVSIMIPYVDEIHYPARFMRVRRDHIRFLYLIAAVCHIRQYQKELKHHRGKPYIEADHIDYQIAYRQLVENNILSNISELPQGARDLYEYMRQYARKAAKKKDLEIHEVSMTQRDLREYSGFGQMWIKRHIRILVDYEYVRVIRGGSARSKGHYRLLADEPIEVIEAKGLTTPEEIKAFLEKRIDGAR